MLVSPPHCGGTKWLVQRWGARIRCGGTLGDDSCTFAAPRACGQAGWSVCVCVNSTSRGGRSLATPAYQGRLALVSLPLVGADINKIKSATLTLPSAQGRPFTVFDNVGPTGPCTCDNIHSWISLSGDLAFSHQHGIYGFKFPERFLEISS